MYYMIAQGLLIPFLGTTLGSCCVFFMRKQLSTRIEKVLSGFAAGVMIAAAVWSLLIPSMEQAENLGRLAFIPAVVGLSFGMMFLLLLDVITPHMHADQTVEGPATTLKKTTMMVLAVTLHNIPEGMAVGVVYAGWMTGNVEVSYASALALAIGIAIQNFPEGAIISMPLKGQGVSKKKSCLYGILSGIVEPLAGLVTVLISSLIVPILPYLLSFAAGAMIYVVVEELVPEMAAGEHSNVGTIAFMIGFCLMMTLDVALA